MRHVVSCLWLFMTVAACSLPDTRLHTYNDYLNAAVGHADHDMVAKKMGAPNRRVALDKGGDQWIYGFCQPGIADPLSTAGPTGTVSTAPDYCQHLNLVFDKSGKLTEWHDKAVQPWEWRARVK